MRARHILEQRRRGAIAPLTAVLSLFIVGMVAFAVDVSWIALTQSELQNAADASALAGANKLMDYYVLYQMPSQTTSQKQTIMTNAFADAKKTAKEYAGYNGAGGVNALALRDEDIELGFLDDKGNYTAVTSGGTTFPNSVKVLLRRDDTSNKRLNLFFAPALGTGSIGLTATARATIYGGVSDGFRTTLPDNAGLLPMTYDVQDWQAFLNSGKSELQVYPLPSDKGNFGLLGLDDDNAGTSEVRNWIDNGLPTAGIQTLIDRKLIPLAAHDPNAWDWNGNPGFRSAVVQDVNNYTGKTFTLPLFKAYSSGKGNYQAGTGQGSNYNYNIVAFVGVRIMPVNDANREVVIQPAPSVEVNAVFKTGTFAPAGTYTTELVTTFVPAKLTN